MTTQWERPALVCCSVPKDDSASDREDYAVHGIDVAAIAFVVKANGRAEVSHCGLHDVSPDIGVALDGLLGGGNESPPATLDGPGAFVDTLRRRDHRGALAIVDPVLFLDRDGSPVRVALRVLNSRVGAGYLRVRALDGGLEPCHNVGGPTDGKRLVVKFDDLGVQIEHWQRFGMANPVDPAGRYGDAPAPLGWIRATYRLDVTGQSSVHFGSSYLPSCWFYRDWMRVHRRDMLQASRQQIEQMLLPVFEVPSGTTWARVDTSTGQVHVTE